MGLTIPKIAINRAIGGFTLSHKAIMRYAELVGIKISPYYEDFEKRMYFRVIGEDEAKIDDRNRSDSEPYYGSPHYFYSDVDIIEYDNHYNRIPDPEYFNYRDIPRDDPLLIQVIEELSDSATGSSGKIKVVDVSSGVDWEIDENDMGYEWVQEKPRKWY